MATGDTCTPTYALPYPTGASRPCDYDETSCEFAEAVETQLDLLDAVVQRTETTIPMAWIRTSLPFSVVENGAQNTLVQPPFDTTVVDTDNMVDLIQFNGVTINTAGLYLTWLYIRGIATVVTSTDTGANYNIVVEPPVNVNNIWFPLLRFTQVQLNQVQRAGVFTVMNIPANTKIAFNIDPSGFPGDTIMYLDAEMAFTWLGDTP